jgi:hypothetical protein
LVVADWVLQLETLSWLSFFLSADILWPAPCIAGFARPWQKKHMHVTSMGTHRSICTKLKSQQAKYQRDPHSLFLKILSSVMHTT